MAAANEKHVPKWFEVRKDELTGEDYYHYKGGYFEARAAKKFHDCLDIYS